MIQAIKKFIREAKDELFQVNWPTKKQTMRYTMLVVGISVVMAVFLGGLDYVFSLILKSFIIK